MSNKRRRTKGTGSVYTRKDGRVVGEYEVNGRTRYIYGRDEKQIADRVAEAIRDRDAGIDSENMTVGGYLDRWLTAIRDSLAGRSRARRYAGGVMLRLRSGGRARA